VQLADGVVHRGAAAAYATIMEQPLLLGVIVGDYAGSIRWYSQKAAHTRGGASKHRPARKIHRRRDWKEPVL
jgi:hypothetical protein